MRVADAIASLAPSFQKLFQLSFLLAVNLKSDNKPTQGNASSVIDDAGMGENVGQTLMRLVTASEKRKKRDVRKLRFPWIHCLGFAGHSCLYYAYSFSHVLFSRDSKFECALSNDLAGCL